MPIWLSRNGTDVRVVIQQEYIMEHFLYIISDKDVWSIHWGIPSKNAMWKLQCRLRRFSKKRSRTNAAWSN